MLSGAPLWHRASLTAVTSHHVIGTSSSSTPSRRRSQKAPPMLKLMLQVVLAHSCVVMECAVSFYSGYLALHSWIHPSLRSAWESLTSLRFFKIILLSSDRMGLGLTIKKHHLHLWIWHIVVFSQGEHIFPLIRCSTRAGEKAITDYLGVASFWVWSNRRTFCTHGLCKRLNKKDAWKDLSRFSKD